MDSDNEDDIIAPLIQKERILGGRVDKLKSVDESIDGVPVDDSKMLSSKYRPIESSKGLSRSTRTSDKSSSGSAYSAFPKDPQSNMRSFSQARKYPDLFKDEAKKTRNDQYLREPISSTVRNKFMRPGDEMEDIASRSRALKSTSSSTKGKFVRPDDSAAFELPRERKRDDRSLIRSADSKLARERESGRSPMSSRSISIEEASLRKLKERRDIDKKDSRPTKVADTDRRNTLRSDSKSDDNNRNREHFLKESRRSSKVSKKKEDIKAVKLSWHSTPVDRRKGESEVPQNEKASTSKNPLLRGLKQASKNTSQGKVTTVGNQRVPQPSKKGADELPETQNNSSPGSILPQQSFLQNAPPMGVPSDVLLPQDQASVQNLFMGLLNNFNNQGFMSNNMGMPGNFPAHPEQLFMQSGGVSALTNNHISPDQMFMQNSNNGLPPNIGLHPSAIQEALMQQEAFLIQSGLFQNAMQGVMPPAVAQSSQQASNTPTSHNFPQPGILDMRPPPTHGSAHQGLSSMQQPMTSMGGVGLQATPAPHELPSSALLNNPQSLHKTPSSRFNNPQKDCNLLTYPHSSLNRTPANQNLTHMSTEPSFLESPSIPPPTAPQVFRSGGGQTSDLSHVDEVMKKLAPDGTGSVKYPAPDTNLLLFDPEIGYRYDPGTGLHYDANSGYFFNSKMKVFLYWDLFTQTYLRVENPTIPFPNLQNKKESIDSNYKHSLQPSTDSSALHRKRSPSPGFNRRMDIRNRTRSPANGKKHLVSRSPQRKRARSKSPLGLSVKRSRSPSPGRRKNPINSGKRPGSRSPRRKTTNSRSPVRPFKKQSPSSGPSRRDKRSKSPKTTRADNHKRTGVTRRRSHSPRLVARRRDQFGTSRTLDEEDVSARPSLVVTVLNIPTEGVSIEKKSPERKLSIDESPGKNTEHTDGSRTIGSGLKGLVEKNDERTKDSKVCGGKNDKSEEKSKSSRRNSSRDRRNDPKKDDKKPSNKETNNKSSDKRPDKRDVEKNSETTKIAKQEEDSSTGEGRNHRLVSERQFSTGQTREVLVKGLTLSQEEISQSKPKPLSKFDAPSSVESKKLDAVLLVDLPGVPDDLSEFVILDEDEEESNDEMTEEALQLLLSNPSDKSVSSNAEDEPEQQGDNLCPIINSSASSVAAKNESPHSINKSADSSTDLEAVPVGTGYSGTSSCVHESDSQEKRISGDSKDEKIPQKVVDNNSQDKLVLQQISTYSEPPSPTNSIYSSYDFSDDEKYVTVSATQDEDGNEEKNYVDEGKDVSSKEIFSEGQNAEDVRIDESKIDETPLGSKSSNIDTKDVEIPKPSKATEKNNETEKQPEMNETFNSIVKTVGKNDELHQEAIVETTTEPIINEEVGERVDKFVKNNEPVTIQNDDAKKDSITTNQIPINDTDISKQVVQISSGTGQAGVESLTGCQRQENEKQIQGTEQDEGEIISGCHGQHNEKQIQGTGQDENVILTGSQEKQNVIQVEGTGLDEDKMLTDSLEKHNENEVHGTEQDENKIVIGSKEEQDEKQVQGTGQEEHTSSQEKQVLCTKQDEDKILAGSKEEQNEKQDQGTGQDENTSSQENQVQCTGEDENKILAGPKKEQNEKQVQGTGQDESKLHTSSLENLVQCTGQDENKILAGPKEEQNEKQVQGSGPDENTILAGSQEKQLQGSGHDEDKILTGSQSEKHVQGPGQDEDKILIGSKEEQNEKQLQGSGHDEDKILIGSKEEQNEKQLQGSGHDEDKILIGSKEEQNEKQLQGSGHDEDKILIGSKEEQNEKQLQGSGHDEDKILIGSKEEQNEKQLQGSGHDEDKILIGSKEEQNEKQAQGPGQDEDKILIGSKEEQNENQAQISGHDEHKIVTGSQEKQNKEQSLDAVHVEDIPDSEKFSEVARVDVSKKEPGTSQGRKVGNVFARLGGHASNSEKSASVPKISENRVGGDKDPMSDLYTSQPRLSARTEPVHHASMSTWTVITITKVDVLAVHLVTALHFATVRHHLVVSPQKVDTRHVDVPRLQKVDTRLVDESHLQKVDTGHTDVPRLQKVGSHLVDVPRLQKVGSRHVDVPRLQKVGLLHVDVPRLHPLDQAIDHLGLMGRTLAGIIHHLMRRPSNLKLKLGSFMTLTPPSTIILNRDYSITVI
ncbi:hypothetical protein GE061_019528 [Apolygus lucorum]|uniref:OCRE domain-containing protein n=1 Tax=Apolygus lucorum TaxID=248454 RepID=A0A8S9X8N7_APOLU|nr:hypothetical protein GE061_019528 [Apolygus lucorum]